MKFCRKIKWIVLLSIFLLLMISLKGEKKDSNYLNINLKTTDQTKKTYSISYELDGGNNSVLNQNEITEKINLPIKLWSPSKVGFHFSGWYLDKDFTREITDINEYKKYTLYAKWTRNINNTENIEQYFYKTNRSKNVVWLKELQYRLWNEIDVPGNPATILKDYQNHIVDSKNQCPQGLCMTEDYVLITAYAVDDALGTLAIYDRKTGEHIKSFGMEGSSHLGGIAYDGQNIWICHSDKHEIQRISFPFIIKLMRATKQSFIDISNCFSRYSVSVIPSSIFYKDDKLYVAEHNRFTSGRMNIYHYNKKTDSLKKIDRVKIPAKTQGVAIDQQGKVYISSSYGRVNSSYLYQYESIMKMNQKVSQPAYVIEMPPGSEQLFVENEQLYVVFETACSKYYEGKDGKGSSICPIDRILILDK